jgi:hypothetical protein
MHTVAAAVHSVPGCLSARQESRTKTGANGITTVTLTPRACGYFSLDALPKAARFTLSTPSAPSVAEGAVRLSAPLVLPVGKYTLTISAPYCAEFRGPTTITAGKTKRERVRLICR